MLADNEQHYSWFQETLLALAAHFFPPDLAKPRQPWTSQHSLDLVVVRRHLRAAVRATAARGDGELCRPFVALWRRAVVRRRVRSDGPLSEPEHSAMQ